MLLRCLVAGGVMLAGVSAASAASFDCKKASTPFETAICSHPDLSAKDETLSVAYLTAIGGLSKPALGKMQASQKTWLDYAQKACSEDAKVFSSTLTDDQAQCLVGQFDNRIRRLEQSRMWDGMRFYIEDRLSVIPDTTAEPDAYTKVSTFEAVVPRIDGNGELAKAFADFVETQTPGLGGEQDETSDVTRTVSVEKVTSAFIEIGINDYWYGHGAAHGNYSVSYAHFLRDKMRPLEASDIFAKEGWETRLGELALAALDAGVEGGIWDDSREEAAKAAADVSRWQLSWEGLTITYQPYEVTAYAAGAPTITIPWAQLTDDLAEGAMELLY